MAVEFWDLLNIKGTYRCHKRCMQSAISFARKRNVPILLRHHGPGHLADVTRVNKYVHPNGRVDVRSEDGKFVDAG